MKCMTCHKTRRGEFCFKCGGGVAFRAGNTASCHTSRGRSGPPHIVKSRDISAICMAGSLAASCFESLRRSACEADTQWSQQEKGHVRKPATIVI